MQITRIQSWVETDDGWRLPLCRFGGPERVSRRPVILVPGYAMNSFILGYHPTDLSLAEYLASQGLEVWTVDLRGQGDAARLRGSRRFGLAELALKDLPAVIEAIVQRSDTGASTVDVVGCSLGATFMFMHAAWSDTHRVARMVNLGGPLRWTGMHPALRAAFRLAPVWSRIPIRGTRRLARRGLPLAKRLPKALHLYLHPGISDISQPEKLTQTVDDPVGLINRQIARWARKGDLCMNGRNLTEDVARLTLPLLTILANADGIVPEATACSAHNVMCNAPRQIVRAGDHQVPMAHADLFISEPARDQVFAPLARWLLSAV